MKVLSSDFRIAFERFITTTGFMVVLTMINLLLFELIHYRALGMIYLMGITTASLYLKNYNIILATVLGAICWNLIFIPPRFAFTISAPEDWALLVLYLVAGIVIGTLLRRLKDKEIILIAERNRATQLYAVTKALSSADDVESLINIISTEIKNTFKCPSSVILNEMAGLEFHPNKMIRKGDLYPAKDEEAIIQYVVRSGKKAGRFTADFTDSSALYYPLIEDKKIIGILVLNLVNHLTFSSEQWLILESMARQLSTGLLRERLETELRGKMIGEESERIYKTLLNSVSHELRTPLSAIKGFSSALLDKEITNDPEKTKTIAYEIFKGVERLDYVVQNLLDMSRLESGNLKLKLDYVDVVETVSAAVKKVKKFYGEKVVNIDIEDDLPLVFVDYFLIEQTFENIIRNAFLYTPERTPVDIKIGKDEHFVNVEITDFGPGIKSRNSKEVFKKFFRERPNEAGGLGLGLSICKSIMDLHRGYLSLENIPSKGASFTIKIPRDLDRETESL